MKTENFLKLANGFTGRKFSIYPITENIEQGEKYFIYTVTPILKIKSGFNFKIPLNEENIIRSFINTFCSKYREPNPNNYNGNYYGSIKWDDKTPEQKEYCFHHHSSNMFSKQNLLAQVKQNLNKPKIENILCRYGFYPTIYGIGLFILFSGVYELNAIKKMESFLKHKNIPFTNEFSNAKWVYRFKLNIDKKTHENLLFEFSNL